MLTVTIPSWREACCRSLARLERLETWSNMGFGLWAVGIEVLSRSVIMQSIFVCMIINLVPTLAAMRGPIEARRRKRSRVLKWKDTTRVR
jgi:hypothetical protein